VKNVEDSRTEHERIETAEAVTQAYLAAGGPELQHGASAAFYMPSADRIAMPDLEVFESPEHYYSTLFHELTHSTGHRTRLNRSSFGMPHRFGDVIYAEEELVAEMGAAMACAALGIDQAATLPQSAAYIENWLGKLRNDRTLILEAAAAAQRAGVLLGLPELHETAALEQDADVEQEGNESVDEAIPQSISGVA
jgi:antirestriction protein ArdC